jgi:hypothetical protein
MGEGTTNISRARPKSDRWDKAEENSPIPRQVLCAISNHSVLWHDIRSCEMAILSHVMASPSINFNAAG